MRNDPQELKDYQELSKDAEQAYLDGVITKDERDKVKSALLSSLRGNPDPRLDLDNIIDKILEDKNETN